MPRLLIISNRLPVTVRQQNGTLSVAQSPGGLATALSRAHERMGSLWFGWPGDTSKLSPADKEQLAQKLAELGAVPLELSQTEINRYYDGFSNGVLWPLFHYLLDKVQLDARRDWDVYRAVNERFADLVAQHYEDGDLIWIQDYQLTLLPAALRKRLPNARIGFFLHTPFPAAEVFRLLPWREQVLRGLLGADLLGFHTDEYRHHFDDSVAHVLGVDADANHVAYEGRSVRLGVFPISVDAASLSALARQPEVRAEAERIRAQARGQKIVLGVDRLDYTKGISRRLLAFGRLLESDASWRGRVRFIQLAVPSRDKVAAYGEYRRLVNETVARINGLYGTVSDVPIHYLYRSLPLHELVALYIAADVMLVTPLRDGMNLVAKEYVVCRNDEDGVLVLSEFAGAAAELPEALQVNPYDVDGVAGALKEALTMPAEERRLRMLALRRHIYAYDVHRWADTFLGELGDINPPRSTLPSVTGVLAADVIADRVASASYLYLLLDYDTALVPPSRPLELTAPDAELRDLVRRLAACRNTVVHLISGRPRATLESWFGALPVGLHAEHGFWSRAPGTADWGSPPSPPSDWKDMVRPLSEEFSRRVVGSQVEEKTASVAWHYRGVHPDSYRTTVHQLRQELARRTAGQGLALVGGPRMLEIRLPGIDQGAIVPGALQNAPADATVVIVGGDHAEDGLFTSAPASAVTVRVGEGEKGASYRLKTQRDVRVFLHDILAHRETPPDAAFVPHDEAGSGKVGRASGAKK